MKCLCTQKEYKWDVRIDHKVRKQWEIRAKKRYSDMQFKMRDRLKREPNYKPPFVDNDTWAKWKSDWEHPERKAVSTRNSSNRRGGGDKAEATHIGGSVPHAKTMWKLVNIQ